VNSISQTIIHGSVTTNNYITHAWDTKDRLVVSIDLLRAAFREDEMLRDYCESPEKNRLDPEYIARYVLEALMAVIRQAHRSPECHNIRANPSRADQVQVLVREGGERWEILTLAEAVRLLFRDAAGRMAHLAGTAEARQELTPVEQIASLLMPHEYHRSPDKYEREGKGRVAAHLASLGARPASLPSGPASPPTPARKMPPDGAPGAGPLALDDFPAAGSEPPNALPTACPPQDGEHWELLS
jgi:hypothetical protein